MILKRTTMAELVDRISLVDPNKDVEVKNANRWLTGSVPSAQNAWYIGEALNFHDEHVQPLFDKASGLASLLWFNRFDDFVGVIGCTQPSDVLPFEDQFMAMLRTIRALSHISPFDILPVDHNVLALRARPTELQRVAESNKILVPESFSYADEARALNDRRLALEVWNMPEEMRQIFKAAGNRWFQDPGLCVEVRRTKRFPTRSEPLRKAFTIARSNMDREDVVYFLVDHLSQWMFSTAVPEPPEETVANLFEFISNPNSATSHALRMAYRSFRLINDLENESRNND